MYDELDYHCGQIEFDQFLLDLFLYLDCLEYYQHPERIGQNRSLDEHYGWLQHCL